MSGQNMVINYNSFYDVAIETDKDCAASDIMSDW